MLGRRKAFFGLLAAPAVIRFPELLMPVRTPRWAPRPDYNVLYRAETDRIATLGMQQNPLYKKLATGQPLLFSPHLLSKEEVLLWQRPNPFLRLIDAAYSGSILPSPAAPGV